VYPFSRVSETNDPLRCLLQDFVKNPSSSRFADVPQELLQVDPFKSLTDKTVEKTMLGVAKAHYSKSVEPGMDCCKRCGNMYTASLYGGLASLLSNVSSDDLVSSPSFPYGIRLGL
jgi:hydroxymethylglutaryl-CoA synthase